MNHLLPFQPKPLRQAVIFMGIQASGKSTFFERELARHGYVHVNLDTLHTRRNEQMAIQECYQKDLSFVVDNTNPERTDRSRYISEAKAHGYEVIGVFFQSILRCCIERNGKRERQVPAHAIACTQNKLELPDHTEGFDRLFFVKMTDGGFDITSWIE